MKKTSPHLSPQAISNIYSTDNCNCLCHYPEEIQISEDNSFSNQSSLQKKLYQKKNNENLCICDKKCSCSCHNVSCLCCPCVKEKKSDYYKNLYSQIKSELEIEKRRCERMKFDKEMNKQNYEKEKQNLLLEISQLKKQLSETIIILEREEEKNIQRDEEVFNYKNEDLPKLQKSYENIITSMKEEKDKLLNEMTNKIEELAKENISLKYQLKKNTNEKVKNINQIIEELNIEINTLKNELESKNTIINKLNAENDELNSHCEEIKSKYNKEMQEIKSQNIKLTQNINLNITEIKKLKDELIRVKKNRANEEQIYLKLKTGNENKENEINNLKRLLIEKEDEMNSLLTELEKLKAGYNNLNMNFSETANKLENFSDLEQRYNSLIEEYNKLKKENNQNKSTILQNNKIINVIKQKLTNGEDNIKNLINEKECLRQEILKLKMIEKKYNDLYDKNKDIK